MRYLIPVLIISVLVSCQTPADNETQTNRRSELFRQFIKKFEPIDLPFVFRESRTSNHNVENMARFDGSSFDTLFLKPSDPDETRCYGILRDTSQFYSLIYFFPADSDYPVLATYTKDGELISKEGLIVNGCGGDCGLQYCSESGIINIDYSIYCADTVKWDFFCDSIGEPIPNSATVWINSQTGHISKNGTITMSKKTHIEAKQNSL